MENREANAIGVALNTLDNAKAAIAFINALAAKGLNIRLRWHPGQAARDKLSFRDAFARSSRITLSDPNQESISEFMEQIDWLIAGNSSIHLEASLAGVMPIYYELTPPDQPDYYGYMKHGLAKTATSVAQVLRLVEEGRGTHSPNADAVSYYSSTYLTEWESREGELVAECLRRLDCGEVLPVPSQSLL